MAAGASRWNQSSSSRRNGFPNSQFLREQVGNNSQSRWESDETRLHPQSFGELVGNTREVRRERGEPRPTVQSFGRNNFQARTTPQSSGERRGSNSQRRWERDDPRASGQKTYASSRWSTDADKQGRSHSTLQETGSCVLGESGSSSQHGFEENGVEDRVSSSSWTVNNSDQSWRYSRERGNDSGGVDSEHSSRGRESSWASHYDHFVSTDTSGGRKEEKAGRQGKSRGGVFECRQDWETGFYEQQVLASGSSSTQPSSRNAPSSVVAVRFDAKIASLQRERDRDETERVSLASKDMQNHLRDRGWKGQPSLSNKEAHDTNVARTEEWRENTTTVHQQVGVRNADKQGFRERNAHGRSDNIKAPNMNATTSGSSNVTERHSARGGKASNISHTGEASASWVKEDDSLLDQPHGHKSMGSDWISGEVPILIVGLCLDMCPAKERKQRERLRDLAVFERLNGNPGNTSRELAVKKFCRTFTGIHIHPSLVRPLPVLWNTLQYLLNLMDDKEFGFEVVHDFLFDRTRAIRQELGMQRLANSQVITMYEEIVRFHILSEHELRQRSTGAQILDSLLNLQQLSKSLISLLDLYGLVGSESLKNKAEFLAYYMLLNLGNHGRFQVEPLSIWLRNVKPAMLNAAEVKFAREVLRCYRTGNFRVFFQLVSKATFLQGCLMELHFNEVRLQALRAINQGAYKLHPIPLRDLAMLFLMKEGDVEDLCNICGLSTGMDSSRIRCLLVKQSQFSLPSKQIPFYKCPFFGDTRAPSYYQQVSGRNRKH